MAARTGIYADWERKGFYYGAQAAYGGADPGTTIKVLENTGNFPPGYAGKAMGHRPTARGLSYPVIEDVHQGRGGVKGYSVEHDLTATVWRDMMILLWQLNVTNSTPKYVIAPQTSGTLATKWASIYQYATMNTDTDASFGGYQVESAVPSQVTLTIPQSDPDSEGSVCTLGVDWIGRSCEEKSTFNAPTPTDDDASKILGHEPTFTLVGASHNILEATISITNGAFLSPEGSSDDLSPRIFLGQNNWTGSIKAFVDDGDGATSLAESLKSSYEDKVKRAAVWTLSTNNVLQLPILVSEMPQMEDVEGGKAINFSFISGAEADGGSSMHVDTLIDTGASNDSPWPTA